MDVLAKIKAPILSTIAQEVLLLIRNDAALRAIQGLNAPRASNFTAGTVTNAAAVIICPEVNSGNGEIYYQAMIVLDGSAGACNYRMDGPPPTAAIGGGIAVPAGGGTLTITG